MYRSTRNVVKHQLLIASSHKRLRYDLSRLVQLLDPSVTVVGEAATSFDVLVRSVELRPDLVMLDLSLRPGNALDLVTHIHRLSPVTAVVVISIQPDAGYRQAAIEAGALDYVDMLELTTMLPATLDRHAGHREQGQSRTPEQVEDTQPLPQPQSGTAGEYHELLRKLKTMPRPP